MVSYVVAALAVFVPPALLWGAVLVVVGRDVLPPSERVPLRLWTRWDVWHHLRRGACEMTRIKLVATGRAGRVTTRGCPGRP